MPALNPRIETPESLVPGRLYQLTVSGLYMVGTFKSVDYSRHPALVHFEWLIVYPPDEPQWILADMRHGWNRFSVWEIEECE